MKLKPILNNGTQSRGCREDFTKTINVQYQRNQNKIGVSFNSLKTSTLVKSPRNQIHKEGNHNVTCNHYKSQYAYKLNL